jgi:hypothetical protein
MVVTFEGAVGEEYVSAETAGAVNEPKPSRVTAIAARPNRIRRL